MTPAQPGRLQFPVKLEDIPPGNGAEIGGLEAHTQLAKPMSSGWESGSWVLDFIGSWEWTIPGGSSEIQRTIIAERGLGLPREPSVA